MSIITWSNREIVIHSALYYKTDIQSGLIQNHLVQSVYCHTEWLQYPFPSIEGDSVLWKSLVKRILLMFSKKLLFYIFLQCQSFLS